MLRCIIMCCQKLLSYAITMSLLFLLISSSSQLRFKVEGRATPKSPQNDQSGIEEQKFMRSQIGSRPPRCDGMCRKCGHCEAIQVPANALVNYGQFRHNSTRIVTPNHGSKNFSTISNIEYARGDDDNSNYRPMSWKCKCGNLIFNP